MRASQKEKNLLEKAAKKAAFSSLTNFVMRAAETEEEKLEIDKESYNTMMTPLMDKATLTKTERQNPIEVNLLLKKPDLLGNSQWEFVFNKVISVKVLDKDFLEKVHKGKIKSLYAGVKLPCSLQIEYDLDEYFNIIPNSDRYTILNVLGDPIEPPSEENLSFF